VMREGRAQTYWVRRLVAFLIDAGIVSITVVVIVVIAAIPVLVLSGPTVLGGILGGVFAFLTGVIMVLYFVAFEVLAGSSVGKRVMGLKVVTSRGGVPNAFEALVRNVSKLYWLLLILDVVIGLALSKGYTQKYTDKLMSTSVVDG
jgi:uncharacterized RDD family membrane protein YckC